VNPVLTTLAVSNYRSLRDLVLPLSGLDVVTGANGTGKSSLYRALRLLADAGQGRVVASLAGEGGLASTLWAGPEVTSEAMRRGEVPIQGTVRTTEVNLRLGFAGDDLGYQLDLGHPAPAELPPIFALDPMIKSEASFAGPLARPAAQLVVRRGPAVTVRDGDGSWRTAAGTLMPTDSMLTQLAEPEQAPEVLTVRERLRSWRFYDSVRTDRDAPARSTRLGTFTPVLAGDGADLASALATIEEVGDGTGLAAAIDAAFPGSELQIRSDRGRFTVGLRQRGLLRPLEAAELSDGTLRYLLWVAALMTPRPPELMVLNEPEASQHHDLLPPLAELVRRAATRCQVIVVSHPDPLVAELTRTGTGDRPAAALVELIKDTGVTGVAGRAGLLDQPRWTWLTR